MEVWKDIKGYEGIYQVSNLGNIKSLDRITCDGKRIKGRNLKGGGGKNIYISVLLCKNGNYKSFKVHRLVAETFIDNPKNLPMVNHKDENKKNNHVENLEWCDAKYNNNYGTMRQRQAKSMKGKLAGEKNPMYGKVGANKGKRKEETSMYGRTGVKNKKSKKVYCIELDKVFHGTREAARETGIHQTNISACCLGKYKSAGKNPITGEKLHWKYVE